MSADNKTLLKKKRVVKTCKNYSSIRSVIVPWRECWMPAQDLEVEFDLIQVGCDANCDHTQYLYRFKNGFGVSLAANQYTRSHRLNFGYMEAVIIYFPDSESNNFEFVHVGNKDNGEPALTLSSFSEHGSNAIIYDGDVADLIVRWGTGLLMSSITSQFQDKFQKGLEEVKSL
jgi:hypothetical protein